MVRQSGAQHLASKTANRELDAAFADAIKNHPIEARSHFEIVDPDAWQVRPAGRANVELMRSYGWAGPFRLSIDGKDFDVFGREGECEASQRLFLNDWGIEIGQSRHAPVNTNSTRVYFIAAFIFASVIGVSFVMYYISSIPSDIYARKPQPQVTANCRQTREVEDVKPAQVRELDECRKSNISNSDSPRDSKNRRDEQSHNVALSRHANSMVKQRSNVNKQRGARSEVGVKQLSNTQEEPKFKAVEVPNKNTVRISACNDKIQHQQKEATDSVAIVQYRPNTQHVMSPKTLDTSHKDITEERQGKWKSKITKHLELGNKLPATLEELRRFIGASCPSKTDGWGVIMRYDTDGTKWSIVSAGPDGLFDTDDDILVSGP